MKKLLLLTAAIIGGVALPTLLMAGTTESITGCETAPAQGSNFTVFVDPTCPAQAKDGGDNGITDMIVEFSLNVWKGYENPPAEEDAE
jgi:hypothetical protein